MKNKIENFLIIINKKNQLTNSKIYYKIFRNMRGDLGAKNIGVARRPQLKTLLVTLSLAPVVECDSFSSNHSGLVCISQIFVKFKKFSRREKEHYILF
jgi:hypothetical protein